MTVWLQLIFDIAQTKNKHKNYLIRKIKQYTVYMDDQADNNDIFKNLSRSGDILRITFIKGR